MSRKNWGLIRRFMLGPKRAADPQWETPVDPARTVGEVLDELLAEIPEPEPAAVPDIPEMREWRGGPRAWVHFEQGDVRRVWRLFAVVPGTDLVWWQDGEGNAASKMKYRQWLEFWAARNTQ